MCILSVVFVFFLFVSRRTNELLRANKRTYKQTLALVYVVCWFRSAYTVCYVVVVVVASNRLAAKTPFVASCFTLF